MAAKVVWPWTVAVESRDERITSPLIMRVLACATLRLHVQLFRVNAWLVCFGLAVNFKGACRF